jgi:hypothetical protein
MPHSIPFPARKLKTALGALALALVASANATTAWAVSATLVLPDVCEDPAAVFDHQWAVAKHGSQALFYMQADGSVREITNAGRTFNNYDTIYIAAHGGADYVGRFTFNDFATHFEAAHTNLPVELFFAVCGSAQGPDSLLKAVNDEYGGNIHKLSGGVTACALTGNGNPALANAEYRIDVVRSNTENEDLYNAILDNIGDKWADHYPMSAQSYLQVCSGYATPFNQANMASFATTVFQQFSQPPGDGVREHSTNYLDLIELNTGGNALAGCGADPAGHGVEVPCP